MVWRIVKLLGVLALASFIATYVVFVRPETHEVARSANAVVVLAGEASRLETGLALVGKRVARVLVVSNGTVVGWSAANAVCRARHPFEVICPKPSSDDTQGEAHAISALARERKWTSLVIVSSNYHLRRAELLFSRCTQAKLSLYSSRVDRISFGEWFGAYLEWPKYLRAEISRKC